MARLIKSELHSTSVYTPTGARRCFYFDHPRASSVGCTHVLRTTRCETRILIPPLVVHGPRPEFIRLTRVFRGIYGPTNSGVHAGSPLILRARGSPQRFLAGLWQREGTRMTDNLMISVNSYGSLSSSPSRMPCPDSPVNHS